MFYTIAFLLLVFAVAVLYLTPAASVYKLAARSGFLFSLLVYLISFFVDTSSWLYKLIFILPRDLTIFTLVLLVVGRFAPRPKALFVLIAGFAGLIYLYFFGPFKDWFDDKPDGRYEFLADGRSGLTQSEATAAVVWVSGAVVPAFPGISHPEDTFLDEYWLIDIPSSYGFMFRFLKFALGNSGYFDDVEFNDQVFAGPVEAEPENAVFDFGLNDPGSKSQWALEALGGAEWFTIAKALPPPAKTAVLAILDTGVDGNHEDLTGRVRGDLTDVMGHGTHVAGIAAAFTNNGKGIASLVLGNDMVRILSVKVLSDQGSGTEQTVIRGVIAAADAGADVISMSLGGPTRDAYQRAMEEAVAYAARRGAITVVAAGNDGDNAALYVPANAAGVITVSALDSNLERAGFSNSVREVSMGLAAPGVNIYATWPGNGYKSLSGTSMATPYIASIAALAKAYSPELNTRELWRALARSGTETRQLDETGVLPQPAEYFKNLKN